MKLLELPKIELHCHLDGSVRPETVIDIAKKENIQLDDYQLENIKKKMTVPEECTSLIDYLNTFDIPNSVMQSKEALKRITFELYEDAARENVKYMEIRFAPLLHLNKGLDIDDVIESVIDGLREAERLFEIKGNIILSCMRTMTVEDAKKVVEEGKKYLGKGVVAIDLCATEEAGFVNVFKEPILLAKEYGYRVTIHAGETGIGENVLEAVQILGAERIGHGVFIRDCEEAYNIVKENNIILEMCPTSNVQTKAVLGYKDHPIYDYHKDGIKVALSTDNRTVSQTDMTKELNIISNELSFTLEEYKKMYLNSVEASFADEETKKWLITVYSSQFTVHS